jgi:DMSO reductase anchor subunit
MLPLVAFSGLVILAAGTLLGLALLGPAAGVRPEAVRTASLGAAAAVTIGLALSLGHLGRRKRMLLVLRGVGRSRLSAEVLLAVLTLVAALAVAASAGKGVLPPLPRYLGGGAGLLLLGAVAWVYALPGQPAWNGPAVTAPLLLGLAWGLMTVPKGPTEPHFPPAIPLAVVLGIDLVCFRLRLRRIERASAGARAAWPRLARRRTALAILRVVLVDLLPPLLTAAGAIGPAALGLAAGIFLERILFYGFALKQTTEAEVDRMEDLLQGASVGRNTP